MHKRFTSCCKTMILVYWIFFLKQMKFAKPITNLSKNSKTKIANFQKRKRDLSIYSKRTVLTFENNHIFALCAPSTNILFFPVIHILFEF